MEPKHLFMNHKIACHSKMNKSPNSPTPQHILKLTPQTTFTASPFQADRKHIAADIKKELETIWEIFSEFSANLGEPVMNPQSSTSTIQASTIICYTTQISTLTNVQTTTTTSHTRPPTSSRLHHTNTSTSSMNSRKSKKSKRSKNPDRITIPRRYAPSDTDILPATNFRLKQPKKLHLSFQHHKTTLQPDHGTGPKLSSATTTTNKTPLLNP